MFGHHGVVKTGKLTVGQSVAARVDVAARAATARNHSVTHLMHKALREVLGEHVQQKGSQVDPDKTRFDFAHTAPMSAEEIREVEEIVNNEILANAATETRLMAIAEAQKSGAMMLFGEKYGDEVRVVGIGSSTELCGGTHVARTGDIGLFKILFEAGVAAGVRRVEAVTGDNALRYVQEQERRVQGVSALLKTQPDELAERVTGILDNVRALEKELARLKAKLASGQGDDLAGQAVDVKGSQGVWPRRWKAPTSPRCARRSTSSRTSCRPRPSCWPASADGKVSLIAGVTPTLTAKVKAGELVNMVAQQVGGKGGGRPDMAQAGGTDAAALPKALASVRGLGRAEAVSLRGDVTREILNERGQGYLPGRLGIEVLALTPSRVFARMPVEPHLLAPNGFLHAASVDRTGGHRLRLRHHRPPARRRAVLHHHRTEIEFPRYRYRRHPRLRSACRTHGPQHPCLGRHRHRRGRAAARSRCSAARR